MKLEFEAQKRKNEFEFRRTQQEIENQRKEAQRTKTRNTTIYPPSPSQRTSQQPAQAAAVFVQRLRTASSLNQVLPLMSQLRQRDLKSRESQFDPRSAHENVERMARVLERPLTDDERREFGGSPFSNELSHLKRIANKAISIKSQSMNGSRATVTVWAHNLARDPVYRYGTGVFTFVAESGGWKFESYQDSDAFFSSMD